MHYDLDVRKNFCLQEKECGGGYEMNFKYINEEKNQTLLIFNIRLKKVSDEEKRFQMHFFHRSTWNQDKGLKIFSREENTF